VKYICLGYYEPAKHTEMTEEERNAMFDECFTYDDHLRRSGHWAGGEALQPSETASTVAWKNGKVSITDGPFTETKEQLGGILFLEAGDMSEAKQIMSQHPAIKYGSIFDIRPVGDITEIVAQSEKRRGQNAAR
jgi:hypothetical protein